MYTAYALAEPLESITWKDLMYIGISQNIQYRYGQHLSCSDDSQKEKNIWVRGLLSQEQYPSLWLLQDGIETIKEAREREQYFIRYAMSQGAILLNKQITYIGNEREVARQQRETNYAEIQKLKQRGYFVKRSVFWHPSTITGERSTIVYTRIHMRDFVFLLMKNEQGAYVPLGTCSDACFDVFIKQYLSVIDGGHATWEWEDRLEAINAALAKGCDMDLRKDDTPHIQSRKQSNLRDDIDSLLAELKKSSDAEQKEFEGE